MKEEITKNIDFFSPYLTDKRKKTLQEQTLIFLESSTYRELEDHSRAPRRITYNIHEKSRTLTPLGEIMHHFELYSAYAYKKQRLHFPHLVNVYLLGLLIFHKSEIIQNAIINKFSLEPNRIKIPDLNYIFDFSSNTPQGEFYYRWRLAALCHDFGYPFELMSSNYQGLINILDQINTEINTNLDDVDDLKYYKQIQIFDKINEKIEHIDLLKYDKYRREKPIFEDCIYDHGLYGGLLFLHSMHSHFGLYNNFILRDDNTSIVTADELLDNSLLSVSASITLHNLDSHSEALKHSLFENNSKIYDLDEDPLSYLLKLCDEIQEWYKFEKDIVLNDHFYEKELPEVKMGMEFIDGNILVKNIKEGKKIQKKLEEIMTQTDFIHIN